MSRLDVYHLTTPRSCSAYPSEGGPAGIIADERHDLFNAEGKRLGIYKSHADALDALGRRPDCIGGSIAPEAPTTPEEIR